MVIGALSRTELSNRYLNSSKKSDIIISMCTCKKLRLREGKLFVPVFQILRRWNKDSNLNLFDLTLALLWWKFHNTFVLKHLINSVNTDLKGIILPLYTFIWKQKSKSLWSIRLGRKIKCTGRVSSAFLGQPLIPNCRKQFSRPSYDCFLIHCASPPL